MMMMMMMMMMMIMTMTFLKLEVLCPLRGTAIRETGDGHGDGGHDHDGDDDDHVCTTTAADLDEHPKLHDVGILAVGSLDSRQKEHGKRVKL